MESKKKTKKSLGHLLERKEISKSECRRVKVQLEEKESTDKNGINKVSRVAIFSSIFLSFDQVRFEYECKAKEYIRHMPYIKGDDGKTYSLESVSSSYVIIPRIEKTKYDISEYDLIIVIDPHIHPDFEIPTAYLFDKLDDSAALDLYNTIRRIFINHFVHQETMHSNFLYRFDDYALRIMKTIVTNKPALYNQIILDLSRDKDSDNYKDFIYDLANIYIDQVSKDKNSNKHGIPIGGDVKNFSDVYKRLNSNSGKDLLNVYSTSFAESITDGAYELYGVHGFGRSKNEFINTYKPDQVIMFDELCSLPLIGAIANLFNSLFEYFDTHQVHGKANAAKSLKYFVTSNPISILYLNADTICDNIEFMVDFLIEHTEYTHTLYNTIRLSIINRNNNNYRKSIFERTYALDKLVSKMRIKSLNELATDLVDNRSINPMLLVEYIKNRNIYEYANNEFRYLNEIFEGDDRDIRLSPNGEEEVLHFIESNYNIMDINLFEIAKKSGAYELILSSGKFHSDEIIAGIDLSNIKRFRSLIIAVLLTGDVKYALNWINEKNTEYSSEELEFLTNLDEGKVTKYISRFNNPLEKDPDIDRVKTMYQNVTEIYRCSNKEYKECISIFKANNRINGTNDANVYFIFATDNIFNALNDVVKKGDLALW